jgi:hypothetical protein
MLVSLRPGNPSRIGRIINHSFFIFLSDTHNLSSIFPLVSAPPRLPLASTDFLFLFAPIASSRIAAAATPRAKKKEAAASPGD